MNITIEGGKSKKLLTGGKYCTEDIVITAENNSADIMAELDSIILGTVTSITNNRIAYLGEGALESRRGLVSVSFPNVTETMQKALSGTSSLKNVDMPSLTYADTQTFSGSGIEDIILPSLEEGNTDVFFNCKSLRCVDLPNCKSINNYFFDNSTIIACVLRKNAVVSLRNVNAFNKTPVANGTGYIYVPSALVDSYKVATNWSNYATQIRALEDYTADGTITGAMDFAKMGAVV